jgi:hypothetical protein
MKIIKRKEFINMPCGTVFSYYKPCMFNELMIKASDSSSWGNDFLYDDIIGPIEADSSDDFLDKCENMENGVSLPVDFENTKREGLFDDKQLFAVYEKEDVKKLIERLEKTLTNPHE